jgi:tRNA (cmo5U34)-methyltransferase
MADFFDARFEGYDEQMALSVASFADFYASVGSPLPRTAEPLRILDIGCGTGLELEAIFDRAPCAQVTAVDLSRKMLEELRRKYADRLSQITLVQGSYLEVPFGEERYDYAVSVMTLHHLLPERKRRLYERVRRALRSGGKYVEGDYVVSEESSRRLLAEYEQQLRTLANPEQGAYHIDIPLSWETQRRLLLEAGFDRVEVIWQEGEALVYVAGSRLREKG